MPSLYQPTPETGTVSSTNLTSLYSNTTNFTSGVVNSSVTSVNAGTGVTVNPITGNVLVSIGQDVATTANPVFAGATLGNVTIGVADNQTITTTSGDLVLDSFTNLVSVTANLSITGTNIGLAQSSDFVYSENNDRTFRPTVISSTGNSSGFRVSAPNTGTSASSTLSVNNSNDTANTEFLAIQARGSALTNAFRFFTGEYIANVINATNKSVAFVDNTNTYATVNPAGPTIGTDLTTKTYVDAAVAGGVTSITGTANQVIASSPTGAVTLSLPQSIATTSNVTFADVIVGDDLTVQGNNVNLAQATTIGYDESGNRANRPQIQSTTGNSSGFRILAPNATTSANSSLNLFGSNDIDNGSFLGIATSGSTTVPFSIRSGSYTAGVFGASAKSISIIDGSTTYATINPAGPTITTDLTTKTYVDGLIPTVVTYDYNATSTTGGANLNLVGSNATTDTVKLSNGGGITATYTSGTEVTLGSTATSANTASAIVARDASGDFSAGTITATLSGTATQVSNSLTAGTHLSGGPFNGSSAVTLTTDATDAATPSTIVARDASGNFAASGATLGNVTVGVDTDQTISTSSGNLVLQTAAGVNAGTVTLTAGANGAITLDPNGTGSVVNTFSNGGNVTNDRNYITGSIRNATTRDTNGDIWELNTSAAQGATNPYFRGVSLSNSSDTTRGPATLLRSYTGNATAGAGGSGSAQRGRLIFEKARGFPEGVSTGPSAVQSGDLLGSIDVTGYTSTGWLNDTIPAVTGFFGFAAQENWVSNTALGTNFTLTLAPTATTISTGANLVQVMNLSPQTMAFRGDAYTFSQGKTGTTQNMALDVNGNLTVTGDIRVNGGDIQNPGGTSAITLTSANTATTIRGDTITLQTAASAALPSGKVTYGRQYIEAYSTADQTNPVINTENLMSFNNTGISNGISIVTNGTTLTRITMANAGLYNIQFSAQLNQTSGGAHNAFIWLKKNGANVANSAGDVRVAGNGERIMAAWNYVVDAAAGDYYELAWASDGIDVLLDYVAASAPMPAVPSVILTVVPVGA